MDETTDVRQCPECRTPFSLDTLDPSSSGFCRGLVDGALCDYPLFWAPTVQVPAADPRVDFSRRRLPGVQGQEQASFVRCPSCGELNDPDRRATTHCVRCSVELYPRPPERPAPPPPPEAPPPAPAPEPVVVVPPAPVRLRWWTWPAIVAVALAEVALVVWWIR